MVEAELIRRGLIGPAQKAMNTDREDLPPAVMRADRLEPLMRRRFLNAIEQAKEGINPAQLAQAVRTGNTARILEELKLAELEGRLKVGTTETLRQGFMAGARVGADRLEARNIRIRFDLMNPHAVQWAEARAGKLITELMAGQRIGVQQLMADAQRLGRTVDETARDIKTFIGLHSRQQDAKEKLRTQLEERGLPAETIDRKVSRYAEGLLNQRARTIARTEMVHAAHYGQRGQWDEASRNGLFDKKATQRIWITTVDDLTDVPICLEMDGQTVGYDDLWDLPEGYGSVKIPGESHPNCRCSEDLLFSQ
jgi:hypothetical protein